MALKHWILGGLGFALGGPIGAIIGVVIASLFDASKALPYDGETSTGSSQTTSQNRAKGTTQSDIRISILILVAAVMKADGHVKKSELEVVKTFLYKLYPASQAQDALLVLKNILQQDINYIAVANQIRANINYSTRLEIVHVLLDIANADQQFDTIERDVIESIARALNIMPSDFKSLLALYQKQVDPKWMYQALEITPEATDEEVKKAYRRMAMKYHPDKLASAPEEVKQKATEKFRDIQQAYETIKTARGIK